MALSKDQMAMAHEQNMTALTASQAAQQELNQHGLEIEKRQFEQQAQQVQQQLAAQQQAEQTQLEHAAAMQQKQTQQPPTGEV